jgi:hypothetical protein
VQLKRSYNICFYNVKFSHKAALTVIKKFDNSELLMQRKVEFSLKLATAIGVFFQVSAAVPLVLSIYQSSHISLHMRRSYNVYHDLAGATARMLMSAKIKTYSAEYPDYVWNAKNLDIAPPCGSTLNHASVQTGSTSLPHQVPFWALPDDDSGLGDIVKMLVRTLQAAPAHAWLLLTLYVFQHLRSARGTLASKGLQN